MEVRGRVAHRNPAKPATASTASRTQNTTTSTIAIFLKLEALIYPALGLFLALEYRVRQQAKPSGFGDSLDASLQTCMSD
jgi:hypothetical protein